MCPGRLPTELPPHLRLDLRLETIELAKARDREEREHLLTRHADTSNQEVEHAREIAAKARDRPPCLSHAIVAGELDPCLPVPRALFSRTGGLKLGVVQQLLANRNNRMINLLE